MKLRLLSILFRASATLCKFTAWLHYRAQIDHIAIWQRCTAENLATCNRRAACKEILS